MSSGLAGCLNGSSRLVEAAPSSPSRPFTASSTPMSATRGGIHSPAETLPPSSAPPGILELTICGPWSEDPLNRF
eukprot:99431-Rhodomonas_salina.1